jgi:hypothetical protein
VLYSEWTNGSCVWCLDVVGIGAAGVVCDGYVKQGVCLLHFLLALLLEYSDSICAGEVQMYLLLIFCDFFDCSVYNLTLFSFVLAFLHFASEIFIYKTAASFSMGVAIPFIISGGSAILMVVGQYKMNAEKAAENDKENEFIRFPRHKEAELLRMAKHKKAQ